MILFQIKVSWGAIKSWNSKETEIRNLMSKEQNYCIQTKTKRPLMYLSLSILKSEEEYTISRQQGQPPHWPLLSRVTVYSGGGGWDISDLLDLLEAKFKHHNMVSLDFCY